MEKYTISSLLSGSVKNYGDRPALSWVGDGESISYSTMGAKISSLAGKLEAFDIKKGDKVAIIGESSPYWGITFLATVCLGAVAVPILPDFHVDEVLNIIKHSESKIAFVSERQSKRLTEELQKIDIPVFKMDTLEGSSDLPNESPTRSVCFPGQESRVEEKDLATIIYTSGTTGSSKGVMLSHKNLSWMVAMAKTIQPIHYTDRFLSVLPLAHTYENSIGFLLPISQGAAIYYLKKQPTPSVLLEGLKIVKPTILLTVPLIIEKIYRKQVLPKFNKKKLTRVLFKFVPTRKVLNYLAGRKLKKVFGGSVHFFGIGGAKLDSEIEKYLREARFPYAIGYGLTESSPMLAGCNPQNTRMESTGPAMTGVTLRLDNVNPKTGEGELVAKGEGIMQGYYKNPEATKAAFTEDGWLRTGDLAKIDKKGNVYIRGRIKNVILGRNGENIYPEEIESVINGIEGVEESLVIQKQGKIVAMVNMNLQELENTIIRLNEKIVQVRNDKVDELLLEIQKFVNSRVNRFSQVQLVVLHAEPFEKTPTKKIKRYLYGA